MFFLELVTRHFTFHAFAKGRGAAYDLLRDGVAAHLRQYDKTMTRDMAKARTFDIYSNDDVREVKIESGQFLRDYEPLEVVKWMG